MIKVWLDTETTGLDSLRHSVVQVALLIDDDEFCGFVDALGIASPISCPALMIHGEFQGERYMDTASLCLGVLQFLRKWSSRGRLMAAGHNVRFDLDFLSRTFARHGYEDLLSLFSYHYIDTMQVGQVLKDMGKLSYSQSLSLSNLCEVFHVEHLNAHDALSDIKSTRLLYERMIQLLKGSK